MRTIILTLTLLFIQPLASWACGPGCSGNPANCPMAAAQPFGQEGHGCACAAAAAAMQADQAGADAQPAAAGEDVSEAAGSDSAESAPDPLAREKLLEQPTERQRRLETTAPQQAQASAATHDDPLERPSARQKDLETPSPRQLDVELGR